VAQRQENTHWMHYNETYKLNLWVKCGWKEEGGAQMERRGVDVLQVNYTGLFHLAIKVRASLQKMRCVCSCVGSCMFNDKSWWDRDRWDHIHLLFPHPNIRPTQNRAIQTTWVCEVSFVAICIYHVKKKNSTRISLTSCAKTWFISFLMQYHRGFYMRFKWVGEVEKNSINC